MKVTAIGDLHGKDVWKEIIDREQDSDKIIFMGDYFDSFGNARLGLIDDIGNFREILEYKARYSDRVDILLGNHEMHYFDEVAVKYGGFNRVNKNEIQELLDQAIENELIVIGKKVDDVLYTHAGLTNTWAEKYDIDLLNIEESLQDLFLKNKIAFDFQTKISMNMQDCADPGGSNIFQGPLWVRIWALLADKLDMKQVVGHTERKFIFIKKDVAFIDVLNKKNQYLNIIDGNFEPQDF